MKLSIHSIKVKLARLKKKLLKKDYWKDKQFPSYWFNEVFKDKEAYIVQIGSNDGKTGDPLNKLILENAKWKVLFVEPVPSSFKKLITNYPGNNRFTFENTAINEGSQMPFYMVDERAKDDLPDLPYWFNQLGSFNESHIKEQLNGKLIPYIVKTILEGITLRTLLERNHFNKVDILHIDTEGYDWKILRQLNLNKYKPTFILFESQHLSNDDLIEAKSFLKNDYLLFKQGIDTLAVNRALEKEALIKIKQTMEILN